MFRDKGLGEHVSSWVGSGANLPISPEQLHDVLGSANIEQLAAKFGLHSDQLSAMLAKVLPGLVDKMTPNGTIEDQAPTAEADVEVAAT
jgi:uncharacterized protein YidB (DUF937 family)